MNSTAQEITKLQKLDSKLKLVGVINISLMLVLIVFTVVMHSQVAALAHKDPSDPEVSQGIQKMLHEDKLAIILCFICAGLMLLWMPARVICLSKLKKLRQQADA
jgi:hypothetical protein